MESFIFALNATLPVVLMVAIGYILKRIGIMTVDFAKMANKLVFRLFLPVMLFMNVYGIENLGEINLGSVLYAAAAVLLTFAVGIPIVILITKRQNRRGALLQSFFRSNNALIGVALAELLAGTAGIVATSMMAAFIIPIFNILSVVSLSIFKGEDDPASAGAAENGEATEKEPPRVSFYVKRITLGIVKNPLLWAIGAGFVALGIRAILTSMSIDFRISDIPLVWKTMSYLSGLATPLALIALGGQFEFSAIVELKKEITAGTLARTVIVPLLTLGIAVIAFRDSFSGAEFAAMIAMFCTPVAVSSVPMAQEMGADTDLASQLVVFTTLVSALTIFVASFALKAIGIL